MDFPCFGCKHDNREMQDCTARTWGEDGYLHWPESGLFADCYAPLHPMPDEGPGLYIDDTGHAQVTVQPLPGWQRVGRFVHESAAA
jgi:hypothetical protein